ALFDQSGAPQDERAHHDLAELGGADHQRAEMDAVERECRASPRTGPCRDDRRVSRELTELSAELARAELDDGGFAVESVLLHDLEPALEDEPRRGRRRAHFEDGLARSERA